MFNNVPILYPLSSLLYRIAMSNDPHDLQKPLPFNEGDRCQFQLLTDILVRMLNEIARVPNVSRHFRQRTCNGLFSSSLYGRIINQADENVKQGFASNKVITSKYTWWNFIFLFLYENLNPFNKFANFYFLCVAVCEVCSFS